MEWRRATAAAAAAAEADWEMVGALNVGDWRRETKHVGEAEGPALLGGGGSRRSLVVWIESQQKVKNVRQSRSLQQDEEALPEPSLKQRLALVDVVVVVVGVAVVEVEAAAGVVVGDVLSVD